MHNGVHHQILTDHAIVSASTEAAISTAMEEQLGLKLEQQTTALPILIVDRAEKPAGN